MRSAARSLAKPCTTRCSRVALASSSDSLAAASSVLASTGMVFAQSADLVAAAKKEGQLTTIALPHDWCGYGGMIDGFKPKYGLTMNELNPDAGSGDEAQASESIEAQIDGYWLTRLKSRPQNAAMRAFRGWLLDAFSAGLAH